jgi:hypothetical protein
LRRPPLPGPSAFLRPYFAASRFELDPPPSGCPRTELMKAPLGDSLIVPSALQGGVHVTRAQRVTLFVWSICGGWVQNLSGMQRKFAKTACKSKKKALS